MKAVVWRGRGDVRVDRVPDPVVQEPNDIVIKVTSSGICGSDLHLYEVFGPFMTEGDILGHEAAVEYAQVQAGGSVAVLGLGPIGDMATRVAIHRDAGSVIGVDAVGMEAHGSPVAKVARQSAGLLPDAIGGKVMETAGVDQTAALRIAIDAVRRGGTISLSGVYGGMADPQAYAGFQATKNGTAKVLLKP
jgi:threonine dehydrogenase-like Zn-dependent dehydrogenase